jgi:Uma2 family endonuclease
MGIRTDTRLTYDDLAAMPDDGLRHEIIDGVHYVTPAPLRHQKLLGRFYLAVAKHLEDHPEFGEVFMAPLDTVFTKWDVVEPDMLFVAADQRHIMTEPNIQGAPALVVEILSPGTKKRDLGVKRQLFDRGGVREYWVIDPSANTVAVHRRTDDGVLAPSVTLSAGDEDVLATSWIPGLAIPLARLFRP